MNNDKLATNILEQIIILNNYDNKTKELFGYSDKNTPVEVVLNNLLDAGCFALTEVCAKAEKNKNAVINVITNFFV